MKALIRYLKVEGRKSSLFFFLSVFLSKETVAEHSWEPLQGCGVQPSSGRNVSGQLSGISTAPIMAAKAAALPPATQCQMHFPGL